MDNSVQCACAESIIEGHPAEMIDPAQGSSDDPHFDWHAFKDFLLQEEHFYTILNALEKDFDQSVANQQQVHNKIHQGLREFTGLLPVVQSDAECNVVHSM